MNKNLIISTSINSPTKAIQRYDKIKNWTLIVVGDKKTPKNYKLKNGVYLSPEDQEKIDRRLSNILGWNCIERRNIGLVYAKKINAEVVALVDDDNIPYKGWGKNILIGKKIKAKFYKTKQPVFDPIYQTNYKNLWHRGFPVDRLDQRENLKPIIKEIKVDVQADFWNGDPDIDAIARIMLKPKCEFDKSFFPFFSNTISPFNSQNTFLNAGLLKHYFLFPDQGRMHDIWASYYLQYIKKINIIYSEPSVYQDRNKHDLSVDLKNELIGLKYSSAIINKMAKKQFKLNDFFSKKSIEAYNLYLKHF
tara:strand:- start:208 stop:1125 length:918 start_codon:yes stop_codon:yes gene_type:complete